MKYKLLAVDMDGTLLDSNKNLSKKTTNTINKLLEKNIILIITTGRPVQGIKKYELLKNIKYPYIAYNGAIIFNNIKDEITFHKKLNFEDFKKIYNFGQDNNTTICIWSNNKLYSNKNNDNANKYKNIFNEKLNIINNIETLKKDGITKIIFYDTENKIKTFLNESQNMNLTETTVCSTQPYFLEYFNSNISKGTTLDIIAKEYNINRNEIIAIGDSYNDISMIEYAGMGIAMGNSCKELKEKADYITTSNDENGVANAIEKFFLNEN